MNAEQLRIEEIVVPGVRFSQWYPLGKVIEDLQNKKRRLTKNKLSVGKKGVYIIGVFIDKIRPIYVGISGDCVRNRINNHFRYSQNDQLNIESGPLAGIRALNMQHTLYVSYYDCDNAKECDRIETLILQKYDFACNVSKKNIQKRRLEDIIALVKPLEGRQIRAIAMGLPVPAAELPVPAAELPVPAAELPVPAAELPVPATAEKPLYKKKTIVKKPSLTVSCGCSNNYTVPLSIKSIKCNCGTEFTF